MKLSSSSSSRLNTQQAMLQSHLSQNRRFHRTNSIYCSETCKKATLLVRIIRSLLTSTAKVIQISIAVASRQVSIHTVKRSMRKTRLHCFKLCMTIEQLTPCLIDCRPRIYKVSLNRPLSTWSLVHECKTHIQVQRPITT